MKLVAKVLNIPGISRARWVLIKEINSFFGSIVALLCGIPSVILSQSSGATYAGVTRLIFYWFYITMIIAGLFLSMSAFVNEKKQGTMELLYTLPVSDLELVLGKFMMGFVVLTPTALAMTLVYVVGIAEAPWYMSVTGAFGLILVAMYAYAIGLFASSLTESYLIALLISAAIVITIEALGFMAGFFPTPIKEILTHMHSLNQYTPFSRGRIPLKGTIYFASLTVFFLFLTVKVLESRRWRG